jgi:hypothetical protein
MRMVRIVGIGIVVSLWVGAAGLAAPASAGPLVRLSGNACHIPPGGDPETNFCILDATDVPFTTLMFQGNPPTTFIQVEAHADANGLHALLTVNEVQAFLRVGHADRFTLFGPGDDPITFSASLTATGTGSGPGRQGTFFGFTTGSDGGPFGPFLADSWFTTGTFQPIYSSFEETVVREFTLAPGQSFDVNVVLSFDMHFFLQPDPSTLNFLNSALLAFDLPDGYYVQSEQGFSGPGSLQVSAVAEPGTLVLFGLAGVVLLVASGRHRRT